MGCNCRGSNSYIPTINRVASRQSGDTLCQQIAKAQGNLPIKVTTSGGILVPTATMPAHATLSVLGCKHTQAEKILNLELSLTALFTDNSTKVAFLGRLGANPTVGSVDALLKVFK
jgi:hypothetical protein